MENPQREKPPIIDILLTLTNTNQAGPSELATTHLQATHYNGVSQAFYRLHYMQIPWESIPWATKTMCLKPCLNLKWILFIDSFTKSSLTQQEQEKRVRVRVCVSFARVERIVIKI